MKQMSMVIKFQTCLSLTVLSHVIEMFKTVPDTWV